MSTDHVSALADFLLSDEARAIRDRDALHNACVMRWPTVTADEIGRGIALARETLRAENAEDPPCPTCRPI